MIRNLKCRVLDFLVSRRVRIGGIALVLAFTVSAATLLGCPIHTIEIFTGQNINVLATTLNGRASATAKEIKEVSYPVYVTCGDNTVTVDFIKGTVADALLMAGFTPDSDDYVEPSLDTVITETVYVDYVNVQYVSGSYTEAIAFDTKTVYNNSKDKGITELTQKGVNGSREVFYTEKLVNGVSTEKTVTETKVLTNPVSEVKTVGTKVNAIKTSADVEDISTLPVPFTIELDANGNPIKYKSKTTVRATAYSYTGNNCSTGVAPQPGYIAVNPKVIPYGTKMYIKSPDGSIIYGYAVAADTGGFIKRYPTGVDLFMTTESACTNFGVRNMEIYILE
ncbi:MAG: G5 domain-containing protein [Clostridia bacterium]|nr:G5 domain-containing protein [Clostridia bacterium]